MSLLRALGKSASRALSDFRHQRDGFLYESPVPTTSHKVVLLALTPEVQLTMLYRYYSALHEAGYWRAATLVYLYTKRTYGCDIAPGAQIGAGIRITHCSDIVIGPDAVIGEDVVLFNGTTLGNRLGGSELGMPKIGDRVMVGTGAKIIGGFSIGDDARIGANAVVLAEVPEKAVAVGIPARVIRIQAVEPLPEHKNAEGQG